MNLLGNWPARVLAYNRDARPRTLQVHVHGLTEGSANGLTAKIAYPMGDDDRDTERQILEGLDVWVFFEGGDTSRPVAFACSGHSSDIEEDGTRRIRQENIELIASDTVRITGVAKVIIDGATEVQVSSDTKVSITAPVVSINGL